MQKYDHYVAVDWSKNNMAIAKMTNHSDIPKVVDVQTDVEDLKVYLKQLKGSVILTVEESTPAQWLYTELNGLVSKMIVCDPYRNKLLNEGSKTDKIDAKKLVKLLKAQLLKEVYHSGEDFLKLRKLVRGYMAITKNGVRLKNQRAALWLSAGRIKEDIEIVERHEEFAIKQFDSIIASNENSRTAYEKEFKRLRNKNEVIKSVTTIPGIDVKGAVKMVALVVDARRFKNKSAWLSYCGLIKHEKISGGKSYGRRNPRYSRIAKSVFKTAAIACTRMDETSVFKRYYEELIKNKNYPEFNARHALARRIAIITLGVLKTGKPFEDRWNGVKNKSPQD